jgi:catechol 2,3-dioxygenase-like lactoylglutathione lyase family enzyme
MEAIEHEITRDIYGMPAFTTLTVADLDRTVDWYTNGLDFVVLFTVPGSDGTPVLVHLRRWRYQDILVRPGLTRQDRASTGDEWTVSVMADADQLDELTKRARDHGGGAVEGPYDTPWNTRDVRTTDPDGYAVVYTARRPEGGRDERFSEMMRREAARQLGQRR